MLRKQTDFKDELIVNKDNALGISLWADQASAETYQTSTYPKIVEKFESRHRGHSESGDLRGGGGRDDRRSTR